MRVGITLPQFRDEADSALGAARRAEALGIDGVFCFDHLWPMGQPGRPALSSGPLLGALAAATSTIHVGTLVARIGLLPDEVLVAELAGVAAISGGRLIAGLGTGDHKSRAENDAFGIPFDPAEERRVRLAAVAVAVAARGIPVWVGGGLPATTELARTVGGAANLWEGDVRRVAELTGAGVEVTWGGPVGGDASAVADRLAELAGAGATWAVCAWPDSLEAVAEAARTVR
jgi:Luciferase-like monooxygenase